ncbi:MAG: M20/M25/M40 family metallo-hydrolase, partial [Chloroflexota bacterium]
MTTTLSHPIPAHSDIQAAIRTRLDWGIEVLQQLIAVDSIAPNELECQRLLYKLLSSEGLATELHEMSDLLRSLDGFHEDGLTLENRPNLVATYGGTKPGSQSLILNAHIDTVEWKTQVGSWKYLPLSGMIDNDCIYGRGALDDKGQIVMAAMAILALKDLAYCPPGKVILESVVGEEPSGNGTLALCSLGYTADAAINLEPTENHLHYGHRGVAGWRFHTYGRAEHGSVNG